MNFKMTSTKKIPSLPQCDTLIVLAVSAEEKALKSEAKKLGIKVAKMRGDAILGTYYWLGRVGNERVIAARSSVMGALGYGGSAELAARFRQATGATSIVQLGMAFGIDPILQKPGDVLVSTHVIPYDHRNYEELEQGSGYAVNYERASWISAAEKTVESLKRELSRASLNRNYSVHFGGILSGAAIIRSESFRNELIAKVPCGNERIIGGEMEGIGLLGLAEYPVWCIVKGISDFADSRRDDTIKRDRPIACTNAARFFLESLLHDTGATPPS